ncbi:MAG: hypothetical protein D3926_20935 [Desulfobacteraceae bacterium]|nr:MAG: hypothetical protein D3926_20935 [Desulfobacteraceae bacterium]
MRFTKKTFAFMAAVSVISVITVTFAGQALAAQKFSRNMQTVVQPTGSQVSATPIPLPGPTTPAAPHQIRSHRLHQVSTMPVPLPGPKQNAGAGFSGNRPFEKVGATPISIP